MVATRGAHGARRDCGRSARSAQAPRAVSGGEGSGAWAPDANCSDRIGAGSRRQRGNVGGESPVRKYARWILAVAIIAVGAEPRAEVRADMEAGDKARHGSAFKEVVGLYTQAIRSGHFDGAALAGAYVKRGNTYRDQGLYDQAISDFAAALKINPGLEIGRAQV